MPNKATRATGLAAVLMAPMLIAGSESHTVEPSDVGPLHRYLDEWRFERSIDRDFAQHAVEAIDGIDSLDRFRTVRFYVFPTAASSLRGHTALAVDANGSVFEVGEVSEFNRLAHALELSVVDAETADRVARDFLRLHYIHAEVWEGVDGGLNFIQQLAEIPFEQGDPEHTVERYDLQLNADLRPPSVVPHEAGFESCGFSWEPFSGSVAKHCVLVHFDGAIEYRRSRVAYPYGKYDAGVGCSSPLDSGPSIDVLERLARESSREVVVAIAEYLDYLMASDFLLHEWFVEEHLSELELIGLELARSRDDAIRVPAARALAALGSHDMNGRGHR